METIDLVPMIDLLDDSVDDLEEALEPLLKCALSETAGKLPMLDRAQLYVLVAYAIESILFCMSAGTKGLLKLIIIAYFRLNGVNSKDHPVFRELTRVKQYFEKIKAAESAGTKQAVKLNKAAAGRFIKHALASPSRHCCAVRFASADFDVRLKIRDTTTIWENKVESKAQPLTPDLKKVLKTKSAMTQEMGQELSSAATSHFPTWSI